MSSKDFGSVDSTIVPTSSVQSVGTMPQGLDSLQSVMGRFSSQTNRATKSRIRRNILTLIRKSYETSSDEKASKKTTRAIGGNSPISLLQGSVGSKARFGSGIPPANLLRPPRGNISFATKDVYKELLCLRQYSDSERSLVAARLIRTLDPSFPTHSELALSLFLIATL